MTGAALSPKNSPRWCGVLAFLVSPLAAQVGVAEVAPYAYKELVPGVSTVEAVRLALGPPPIETEDPDDLRYPADGRRGLSDRLFFRGGKLALVTAASADPRYERRGRILKRLGEPEAVIRFQTQEYLDYTERGLRFVCDADGVTTGVIYFAPRARRVPAGCPNERVDLRREQRPSGSASAPDDLRAGAAELSIAPTRLDGLTADGDRHPVHLAEDLLARAVVFERGAQRIALIGLDVFGLGPWDVDALRSSLATEGLDQVVVAMSHTHANVDTVGFYGHYPAAYAARVVDRARAAALAAARDLRPVVELRVGTTEMSLAGGRVSGLIRNGRDPGVVDPTVSLLQAIGEDGAPVVNVVHLACHPEVIRFSDTRGLSPDFVGSLCRDVSGELGGQTVFLNGALGGMLTPDTRFRTHEAASEMGSALAAYVIRAARGAVPSERHDLFMHRRAVDYPVTGSSVREFLKNPPRPVDFHDGRVRSEMSVVWIGDAQFITVPGELLPDIAFEIMASMPGRLRAVVGLANGELGYLVPSWDFRAGGYEERTGPGEAGGEITRTVGLELAPMTPER